MARVRHPRILCGVRVKTQNCMRGSFYSDPKYPRITKTNYCLIHHNYFYLLLIFLCSACVPYGDVLLNIKGNIKEPVIEAQHECVIEIHQLDNLVASRNIVGAFKETFVFQPKSGDAFDIIVQCQGALPFTYKIVSTPKKVDEYIDLGDISLRKAG